MVLIRSGRSRGDERGAVALLVALMMPVFLLVSALVVDLGLVWSQRAEVQNDADASALAAANALYADGTGVPNFTAAVTAATTYAQENNAGVAVDWGSCSDPQPLTYALTSSPCISFNSSTLPSSVRVWMPTKDVGSVFGGIAGVNTFKVSGGATASIDPAKMIKCALCVVGEGTHALINGDVTVTGSSVHLNGSVSTNSNGSLSAIGTGEQITVEGTASGNYSPAAVTGTPSIGDPLAGLTLPSDFSSLAHHSNPCTDGPGIYGSYTFDKGTCTLQAGLYVITGTWSLNNNTQLNGAGVSIYATCATGTTPRACATTGEAGGRFDGSNGAMTLSALPNPPIGTTSAPVLIAYDRHNTSQVAVQGNGNADLTGTIYAPSAQLYANGNSGHGISGGTIVVSDIYLNGNTSTLRLSNPIEVSWRLPASNLRLTQ